MLNGKELARQFRLSMWNGPAEVENFIFQAEEVAPVDLIALLDILVDRRAASEGKAHALRCVVFQKLAEKSATRDLFVPLVRALRVTDPRVREIAIGLAQKTNNVAGHSELVGLFSDRDMPVRQAAAQMFARCGGKTAFSQLTDLCGYPSFPGRIEAADALVQLAGYHAIPALQNILKVGTNEEKLRGLSYLGNLELVQKSIPTALQAIAVVLKDPSEKVAVEAIRAFGQIADEELFFEYVVPLLDSPDLNVVKAVISSMRRFDSPKSYDAMRKQFGIGPRSVRVAILDTLEAIGTDSVLPLVAEALDNKHITVRMRAAQVLENLAVTGKVDLARTILWLLRSRDVDIKRIAADVAKRVGDPHGRLWPQLLRFLRDEDWWVRERITDALIEMAGTQLTKHVVGFLQEESDIIRRYAVELLMRLADPASLGALVRTAQQDPDWWVRERAIEGIGKLRDSRAVPYLVDILQREPDLRYAALAALSELGSRQAGPHVAALLAEVTEDADLTIEVLRCLDRVGDNSQADAVSAVAAHSDHRVRRIAGEVMNRWNLAEQMRSAQNTIAQTLSTLDRLLYATAKAGADDLLLTAGKRPFVKRIGQVTPLANSSFTDDQIRALVYPHLSQQQIEDLDNLRDVDLSYEVKTEGLRFRVNVFQQHGGVSAVFRIVKNEILDLERLGLPATVMNFGDLQNGLVLIGGPTGSGKSTTLAALIDYVNRKYARHIVTLEDPIEVVHVPKRSLINQREIGTHTHSYSSALRATLREDPDVILVGEMRDLATISFAITAAETGHLVFGTVHTASADTTVDRLINAFPSNQQPQVRSILANSLRAVCCQHLLPRKDGKGRVVVTEVMINTDAVANLIRKGKTFQIPMVVATSREAGMQSMDNELIRLFKLGVVTSDDAYMKAVNKKEFEAIIAEVETRGATTPAEEAQQAAGADKKPAGRTFAPAPMPQIIPKAPPDPDRKPGTAALSLAELMNKPAPSGEH